MQNTEFHYGYASFEFHFPFIPVNQAAYPSSQLHKFTVRTSEYTSRSLASHI